MNFCTNCGTEFHSEAVFCSKCGTKNAFKHQQNETNKVNTQETNANMSQSINHAKTNLNSNGYIQFFKDTLKKPSIAMSTEEKNYGWIQLLLLTVLSMMGTYLLLRGTIQLFLNQSVMGSLVNLNNPFMAEIRNTLLPRFFGLFIVYYGTFIAAGFLTLKVLTKSQTNVSILTTRFFGFLSPNIVILALAGFLSFLLPSEPVLYFAAFLISWSLLLCFGAYNYFMYQSSVKSKLDTFYTLLISNFAVLFILGVLIYIQIEPLLTLIDQLERSAFSLF